MRRHGAAGVDAAGGCGDDAAAEDDGLVDDAGAPGIGIEVDTAAAADDRVA